MQLCTSKVVQGLNSSAKPCLQPLQLQHSHLGWVGTLALPSHSRDVWLSRSQWEDQKWNMRGVSSLSYQTLGLVSTCQWVLNHPLPVSSQQCAVLLPPVPRAGLPEHIPDLQARSWGSNMQRGGSGACISDSNLWKVSWYSHRLP